MQFRLACGFSRDFLRGNLNRLTRENQIRVAEAVDADQVADLRA
jgi:hypothetical protein